MDRQPKRKGKLIERGAIIDAAAPLIIGFVAYSVAAVSTFSMPQLTKFSPFEIALLTSLAGLLVIGLGYASIVFLGGICSLGTAGLVGKFTKTKQVIRPKGERLTQLRKVLIEKSHLVYLPIVLFLTSLALGWDIYSADPAKTLNPKPGLLRFVIHSLNFLGTPQHATGVLFSLTLLPGLIIITMISGLAPSIALPYFRRFKIIGVNSPPFHSLVLTAVFGPIIGLNILVTLLGIFYNVLWAEAPTSYHYAIIVLIGFSLHYSAGTYIGRDKAESIIFRRLANGRYDHRRVVVVDRTLNPKAEVIELGSLLRPQLEE
ncbi:MAG TPA: hypothetical protein VK503_00675 [Candidatus Bathyarchaeia archaeon]|nr:hypothetical protein [Candidatus Bathyarchaeia archaeon]